MVWEGVRDGLTNAYVQKLAAKDLDNWEQKRIKRLPGEPDGIMK